MDIIGVTLIIALIVIIVRLHKLPGRVLTQGVAGHYQKEMKTSMTTEQDVQWQYFLFGVAALSPALAADARQLDREIYAGSSSDSSSSDSSSGDSSCGSSCSSCGGCGGD